MTRAGTFKGLGARFGGERGLLAGLLLLGVGCVLASVLWGGRSLSRAGQQASARSAGDFAHLLAAQADVLLRESDLAGLRRLMIDVSSLDGIAACRVELPGLGVIASTDATEIAVMTLPESWGQAVAADRSEPGSASANFVVPSRGAGVVFVMPELDARGPLSSVFVPALIFPAVFAVGLVALFRLSRGSFREVGIVASALHAASAGERDPAVLRVADDGGPVAQAWNRLMEERSELLIRLAERAVTEHLGGDSADATGLAEACDGLAQGLVVVDSDGGVLYHNGAACVLLGLPKTSEERLEINAMFAEEAVRTLIASALAGEIQGRRVAEIARGEPGKEPDSELRMTVRSIDSGIGRLASVFVEDITQQRLSDRSRNAFVAQATHELRTPLTNIRLYVEQAVDEGDDDPQLRAQALNVINSESRRLERIVSDMLSVSEIEAGSLKIRPGDVRTDALFEDLRHDYAAQAAEKSIDLVFDLPPKMPVIEADRDRLGQALHNVLGNALKYTPPGGKVTVRVDTPEHGGMTVAVSDTGIGIDPDECERIFDRFYRAQDRRIAHVTGSGLGLALAREIARLHGGDISVESQIDHGSTFTLTLPCGEPSGPSAKRAA
jgi:signal transduction histidine kinase